MSDTRDQTCAGVSRLAGLGISPIAPLETLAA
ncbi:hypothetical protein QO011_003486 [Labrys wisconsinensis]|uniref:Uncharacterized protein n=1 Tax=Labrys wisconsinensis TaxID=425677 RepID=A0ABU0J872_9HYPH|nr:hypothetical protein [Labrys wisconsinensis]